MVFIFLDRRHLYNSDLVLSDGSHFRLDYILDRLERTMPHPDAIDPPCRIGSVTSGWSPVSPPWSAMYQPRYIVHSDDVLLIPKSKLAFITQGPAQPSSHSLGSSQRRRVRRNVCCSLPETAAGANNEEAVTDFEAHDFEPNRKTGTPPRYTQGTAPFRHKERQRARQFSGLMRRIISAGRDGRYCSVPITATTGVSMTAF